MSLSSIGEIMENESFQSRLDNPAAIYSLLESSENSRSHPIKLLTSPSHCIQVTERGLFSKSDDTGDLMQDHELFLRTLQSRLTKLQEEAIFLIQPSNYVSSNIVGAYNQ